MNRTTPSALSLLALLLVAAIILTACGSASVPSEPPGITGTITTLQPSGGAYSDVRVVMLVEGGEQPAGAVSDRANVTVTDATNVFDAAGALSSWESLAQGQKVEVWFTGPVAESYPVQGGAGAVRIVE
jgi:hypothetical protein